jgi:hypothetical protein
VSDEESDVETSAGAKGPHNVRTTSAKDGSPVPTITARPKKRTIT